MGAHRCWPVEERMQRSISSDECIDIEVIEQHTDPKLDFSQVLEREVT